MYKRGQLTIFIIVGILIVSAGVVIYMFRDRIFQASVPASLSPAYESVKSCMEEYTSSGIDILETSGGWIYLPDYEPGSGYMPFSSQLNFLGNPIPYWYYISGNNIPKQQVPSKSEMEAQLAKFVNNKIRNCNLNKLYEQGYFIDIGNGKATAKINDRNVEVILNMPLTIKKGEDSAVIKEYKTSVSSNLGRLYNSAKKVYEYEQKSLFLENYGVDTLRVYAPVDGGEVSCSAKTWNANEVFYKLQDAIEANTLALRAKTGDYSGKKEIKYFSLDLPVEDSQSVIFMNSKNWTYAYEVTPSSGSLMIANPVGNQPGVGTMGFCYVAYHFVYNIKYPVLVQVIEGDEFFQFPVAVVIQGNNPRKSLDVEAIGKENPETCNYKNSQLSVEVYDTNLQPVNNAEIIFQCVDTLCPLGTAKNGVLNSLVPQCGNGYIIAKADGYKDGRYLISTLERGNAELVLDKIYPIEVNLKVGGSSYGGQAVISFVGKEDSSTISYPEQKTLMLSEGEYNVSVYVYGNSNLQIPATTTQQCVDIPSSIIGGIFGFTKQKCFDIEIPSQTISSALTGGGTNRYYAAESELKSSRIVEINAPALPVPTTLEQIQNNYYLFNENILDIDFR